LEQLGLDVSSFPIVRFTLETSEREIRTGRMHLPIRLPIQSGVYFESIIRISRVLETSAADFRGTRKFLEIEWVFSESSTIDGSKHPAFSFLADQAQCPGCSEPFYPEPEVKIKTPFHLPVRTAS